MKNKTPNPGSKEAINKGCTCPVMDNGYGRGYMGQEGMFVYNTTCPLHYNVEDPLMLVNDKLSKKLDETKNPD